MARNTLVDFFEDTAGLHDVFIVHDDGYRTRQFTYADVARDARAFAARLGAAGIGAGDKVVVWSENRPEWIAALWGTLLRGAVFVPIDYRASADLLARVSGIVDARVVLIGEEVDEPTGATGAVWPIRNVGADTVPGAEPPEPSDGLSGSSLAEIIFTSGATGTPKGVTLTHRNILSNFLPIEREIAKYRWLERPFHPLRFFNLLPLSHMFGQAMAAFVPPMLGGTVVFSHGYNPADVVRQIKTRRVSVLVCVPKVLALLREHIERLFPDTVGADPLEGHHWTRRWWYYRRVHRLFGWKFWCIVCGAAPLDRDLEAFWRKLGLLVVQGYGLTETAPIVTLNHPMRASRGTVGTPIGGVEVRIADDGEVLVRGENVTSGYYEPGARGTETKEAVDSPFAGGWFHTGDIGEFDASGRLVIKGRRKEMIVTSQGLNVFPEDVERALLDQPGVVEAGVVGVPAHGEERIHAVLVVEPGADRTAIAKGANARLEDHQRIQDVSIWPGSSLPRTEGTEKLRRIELRQWVSGKPGPRTARTTVASVAAVVQRFAGNRPVDDTTTLEELGLSSLDRVELMMALEDAFQTTLDESMVSGDRSVGDLDALLHPQVAAIPARRGGGGHAPAASQPARPDALIRFPAWNRSWIVRAIRRVSLPTWILPLARVFMTLTVKGREHLADLDEPVVFAANHQSHLDTPAILIALTPRWRYRTAPAMGMEFFRPHFHPETASRGKRFKNSLAYYLACTFFNAFPLPQREAGTRQTLRYIGDVMADGHSVLIFPEGRRRPGGQMDRFQPGVGMIAAKLGAAVVPVRIDGLDVLYPQGARMPTRGSASVTFGSPLRFTGTDYAAHARTVEEAVRNL